MDFLTKHWATVLRNASNNETPDKLAIAIGPSVRYILIRSASHHISHFICSRIDEKDLEAAKKVFVQNKVLGILISRSMEKPMTIASIEAPKRSTSMEEPKRQTTTEEPRRKSSRKISQALKY